MKALVFTNDHELTWSGWPEPELGPGDALLSVRTVSLLIRTRYLGELKHSLF